MTRADLEKMAGIWRTDYPEQQWLEDKTFKLTVNLEGFSAEASPQSTRLLSRSPDGKRVAQVSPLLIAVNQLNPYPGWSPFFRDAILHRVGEVRSEIPFDRVRAIKLRYIDRLPIPENPINWERWFTFQIPVPPGFPTTGADAGLSVRQTLPGDLKVEMNLQTLQRDPGVTVIMLDNTVGLESEIEIVELGAKLDAVHGPHPEIFDALLTPEAQSLFGAYDIQIP